VDLPFVRARVQADSVAAWPAPWPGFTSSRTKSISGGGGMGPVWASKAGARTNASLGSRDLKDAWNMAAHLQRGGPDASRPALPKIGIFLL